MTNIHYTYKKKEENHLNVFKHYLLIVHLENNLLLALHLLTLFPLHYITAFNAPASLVTTQGPRAVV